MATKLYFHDRLSAVNATLPAASQSGLGAPSITSDTVGVSRVMDTVIGTAQVSKALTTAASASAQVIYFTRFVSYPLSGISSVSANTWTIGFGVQEANANANFPVTTSAALRLTVYVWRPSTNSMVGFIIDGTGPIVAEATTSETTKYGTFSGSVVNSVQDGDVICTEMTYSVTQGTATARVDTLYYNGTTEPASDNAAASNCASFLSTPQDLTFQGTKLYFHAASNTLANLPSTEQSVLTSDDDADAQTVNRIMDTTKGASETSIANTSININTLKKYYFTKFVTWGLSGISSIAAGTWIYSFAARESNASANFPAGAANSAVYVNCYVWRPSTQSIVGTILDGNSAAVYAEVGAANADRAMYGMFTGSSVASVQDDDVIVFEVWFQITQAASTAYTQTFYYDGTVETLILNATVTDHASFIQTWQSLAFVKKTNLVLPTETVNITESPTVARLSAKSRALATETVSKSETVTKLSAKWRRINALERWL